MRGDGDLVFNPKALWLPKVAGTCYDYRGLPIGTRHLSAGKRKMEPAAK